MTTFKQHNKTSYLSFQLGDEMFAVSVMFVLEVLPKQVITTVPNASDFIAGIINFRGEIVPVIKTRLKFNLPEQSEDDDFVVVILEFDLPEEKLIAGIIADSVRDVINFQEKEIAEIPHLGSRCNTEFLRGMVKLNKKFVMLLDVEKLFSDE